MTTSSFPTLEYRPGVTMNPTPMNKTLVRVAKELRAGIPVPIDLQPGDATRYDLLLVPMISAKVGNYGREDIKAGLYVMRFVGGHAMSCGVILLNRSFHDDLPTLSQGNDWSYQLLHWWFGCLAIEMGIE